MIQLAVLQQPAKFDRDTAIIWINRPPLLSVFGVASCLTLARLLFTFWKRMRLWQRGKDFDNALLGNT